MAIMSAEAAVLRQMEIYVKSEGEAGGGSAGGWGGKTISAELCRVVAWVEDGDWCYPRPGRCLGFSEPGARAMMDCETVITHSLPHPT